MCLWWGSQVGPGSQGASRESQVCGMEGMGRRSGSLLQVSFSSSQLPSSFLLQLLGQLFPSSLPSIPLLLLLLLLLRFRQFLPPLPSSSSSFSSLSLPLPPQQQRRKLPQQPPSQSLPLPLLPPHRQQTTLGGQPQSLWRRSGTTGRHLPPQPIRGSSL